MIAFYAESTSSTHTSTRLAAIPSISDITSNSKHSSKAELVGWHLIVCGAISGLVTKTICAPLDRFRLLYQVQPMFTGVTSISSNISFLGIADTRISSTPNLTLKYRNLGQMTSTILKEEGFRGLWRGNSANICRASCVYGIKFAANDCLKSRCVPEACKPLPSESTSLPCNNTTDSSLPISRYFYSTYVSIKETSNLLGLLTAGSFAGALQKLCTYPLDLLSVRIALGINSRSLASNTEQYFGLSNSIRRIAKHEGFLGFYKGLGPTLATGIPYVALQMTIFDLFSKHIQGVSTSSGYNMPWKDLFIFFGISGSVSVTLAQMIVFPGDVIRKRIMNDGIDGRNKLYKNSVDCAKKIFKIEGFRGFYNGLVPCLIKSIPSGAVQFATYECTKEFLTRISS